MIITTGKIIKIDTGDLRLERSADAPGLVKIINRRTKCVFELPGNLTDAEGLIRAYQRIVSEVIEYRETSSE